MQNATKFLLTNNQISLLIWIPNADVVSQSFQIVEQTLFDKRQLIDGKFDGDVSNERGMTEPGIFFIYLCFSWRERGS
jgi:hypothetical protein